MRRTLIRYTTKPEAADRNAELISAVFACERNLHENGGE